MNHRRKTRWIVLLATSLMMSAACGEEADPLDLGFKRVSLDLVFKDAAKAVPPDPQKVQTVVEFFTEDYEPAEELVEEAEPAPPRRIPRVNREPAIPPCPEADPGLTPEVPA